MVYISSWSSSKFIQKAQNEVRRMYYNNFNLIFIVSFRVLTALLPLFLLCKGQHVEIRCDFDMGPPTYYYGCDAGEFVITQSNTLTIVIVGNHLPNQTNMDVVSVTTFNQPLPFVITEFFTIFPNLQYYQIEGGLHEIQEDAFELAVNLIEFGIFISPLRVLPANAMAGASKLISFLIVLCDKLETIDQNAFSGLDSLDIIQILVTSLRFLPENVFSTLHNLTDIVISGNQIQAIPSTLFDKNLRLDTIIIADNNVNAVARSFVDNFVNLPYLNAFYFGGNSCGNSTYHPSNVDQIHSALQQCYQNYEQRRHFSLELRGSLVIRDENGNVILNAYV